MAGELVETLMNNALPVGQRIESAHALGKRNAPAAISEIHQFLDTEMAVVSELENVDPVVDNRFLKITMIGYLYELGDKSRLQELFMHVKQASGHASSPHLETQAAANVIINIADPHLLKKLIELGREPGSRVVYNVVQTLEAMDLPTSATRSPLIYFNGYPVSDEVEVAVSVLSDYLVQILKASNGIIVVSPGAAAWLKSEGADYVIGDGDTEMIEIEDVLENELKLYGLTYWYDDAHITIATMAEAVDAWASWWKRLATTEDVRIAKGRHLLSERRKTLQQSQQERMEMFEQDAIDDDAEPDDALDDPSFDE